MMIDKQKLLDTVASLATTTARRQWPRRKLPSNLSIPYPLI